MKRLPVVSQKEEEEAPKFEFNFDEINKQASITRSAISEVIKDGRITDAEFSRVFMELQLLEALLTSFKDREYLSKFNKSAKFYSEYIKKVRGANSFSDKECAKYELKSGATNREYNKKLVNNKHILGYFESLMQLIYRTSFMVKNG